MNVVLMFDMICVNMILILDVIGIWTSKGAHLYECDVDFRCDSHWTSIVFV